MYKRQMLQGLVIFAGSVLYSASAFAGAVEITGYGGGLTVDQGVGSHPLAGAQTGFHIGDNLTLFGEFGYSPLLSASQQVTSGATTVNASATAKMMTFGGGIDYSFASPQSRIRPYALLAVGGEHMWVSGSGSAQSGGPGVSVGLGLGNGFYMAVGGGVRFYAGKHWGFKPEVRYEPMRWNVLGQGGFAKAVSYTGGMFYEFGGDR